MKCPQCGHENREGAEFCGKCGKSLLDELICKKCGHSNPVDNSFCDKCGQSLTDQIPAIKKPRPKKPSTIQAYPLFSGGKFAIGSYGLSPVTKDMTSSNHFTYTGDIERVEIHVERPTDDLDLMLEIEREHNNQ